MKRFFNSFLIAISFLSLGFFKNNDPQIKAIICGTEMYMNVLKENFSKEEIFSYEAEDKIYSEFDYLNDEYFYRYIVDIKTGKLYTVDNSSSNKFVTTLKPLYKESYEEPTPITYIYKSEKKGNSIIIEVKQYENNSVSEGWNDNINLKKLQNTFDEEGEKITHNCMYFPLPGVLNFTNETFEN